MIRLTTLGAVRIHRDGAALADLPAQKLRFALLVYLASERDVSRDDVVAMFWPDRDAARGKHALRQMLYELRHVLGEDWIELQRDRIRCRAAIDAVEFESAAGVDGTDDTLALYRGPFMAAFSVDAPAFEGWAERRRAHLGRLHRKLRREQIAALIAARRSDDAIAAARRWVEMDPLDDEAAHALIERLAAAGQRSAALQYYESYERQLRAELDVEPLETTAALITALRRGEVKAEQVVVPDASVPAEVTAAPNAVVPAVVQRTPDPVAARAAPRPRTAAPGWRDAMRRALLPGVRRRHVVVGLLAMIALVSTALFAIDRESLRPAQLPPRTIDLTVLPLEETTQDPSLSVLAAQLGDELSRSLGRSPVINVVSPDGVKLLREQGLSADSVGRMLGADYLVSGRISRSGQQLRLVLSLMNGRSGQLVRDTTLVRADSASRNLTADMVDAAARFLREEVGAQLDVSRGRAATTSERAWQHMLQGRRLMSGVFTMIRAQEIDLLVRTVAEADSQYAIAARLDTRWAEPFILRANAYYTLDAGTRYDRHDDPAARRATLETGLRHAEAALRRDPAAATAHEVKGRLHEALANVAATPALKQAHILDAERAFLTAVDLDPALQSAWTHLARLYTAQGRWAEVKRAATSGYQADPYSAAVVGLLVNLYRSTFEIGEDDQAAGWCDRGRQMHPTLPPFAACTLELHAWSDFVQPEPDLLRRVVADIPVASIQFIPYIRNQWEATIAVAYARAGQADSARAILRRLENTDNAGTLAVMATAFLRLGDEETAMAYLKRSQQQGSETDMRRRRMFWGFRHIPEFRALTGS